MILHLAIIISSVVFYVCFVLIFILKDLLHLSGKLLGGLDQYCISSYARAVVQPYPT